MSMMIRRKPITAEKRGRMRPQVRTASVSRAPLRLSADELDALMDLLLQADATARVSETTVERLLCRVAESRRALYQP